MSVSRKLHLQLIGTVSSLSTLAAGLWPLVGTGDPAEISLLPWKVGPSRDGRFCPSEFEYLLGTSRRPEGPLHAKCT
jgi:hypothetical protein